MKLKAIVILCIILVSLMPFYMSYKYLEQAIKPREAARRFALWLATVFALIFAYTFLVVLLIRLLFPGA